VKWETKLSKKKFQKNDKADAEKYHAELIEKIVEKMMQAMTEYLDGKFQILNT
jgi:hypothetical protein